MNSATSPLGKLLFLGTIASLVGGEVFERRKNAKAIKVNNIEPIIKTRDSEYYLSMIVVLSMLNIYAAVCTFSAGASNLVGYTIFNDNITIVLGLMALLLGYVYFYFSSSQILYKDGIKLSNNKFVSRKDFGEVVYRDTLIKKRS